jgi:hypothetical protein
MERMLKSVSEIAISHSHQSVLTKYTHEAVDFAGLSFTILEMKDFPTGYLYHHDKRYIEDMMAFRVLPKVFHMCWTESRVQKLEYFKNIGMWYLPENSDNTCYTLSSIQLKLSVANGKTQVFQSCCVMGDYWRRRRNHEQHLSNRTNGEDFNH